MASFPKYFPKCFTTTERKEIYPRISTELIGSSAGLSVLITGGGRVGRSIALAYAQTGAKKIILTSRSAVELEEVKKEIERLNLSTVVITYACSIIDEAEVEKLFNIAGNIDILINNAGAMEVFLPVSESKIDFWWNTWTVNVKGTYLCTRVAIARATQYGRTTPITIVNTSSVVSAGVLGGSSAYSSSKTAINRFTEFIHFEYPDSVRAFAYHPGNVQTQLASVYPAVKGAIYTSPEVPAGFLIWLTTSNESDFLRGRYCSCNWDIDELIERKQEILDGKLLFTRVAGQDIETPNL